MRKARAIGSRHLQGIFDDLLAQVNPLQDQVDQSCLIISANEMGAFDADIVDVQNNWNPTNFYTVEQIQQIVGFGLKVKEQAFAGLQDALGRMQLDTHRAILHKAAADLDDKLIDPAPFIKAVREAAVLQPTTNRPVIIESTGLKRWVVNMLKAARASRFACAVVSCARPTLLLDIMQAIDTASRALIAFVKTVAGVVKTALDIVLKIPDFLSTVFAIVRALPFVVIAGGGYYVATKTVLKNRDPWAPWKKRAA